MTTNQEGRQAAIRSATSTVYNTSSDWHALFDQANIADGTFNERLLAWINQRLGTSYTNISGAMYAYAAIFSYDQWHSIATILLSEASQAVAGEANALSLDFTDDYFLASGGFNGSAYVIDATTEANNFDGVPDDLLTYTTTTKKTIMDASGNLVYAAHNLIPLSNDVEGAGWLTSVVDVTDGIDDPLGGTRAQRLEATGGGAYVIDDISTVAKARITVRCWMRRVSGTGNVSLHTPVNTDSNKTLTSEWQQFESNAINSGSSSRFRVNISTSGDVIDVAFPELIYGPAVNAYVETSGSAAYALPYDHNTSGTLRGVLVEPAATNLIVNNSSYEDASWSKLEAGDSISDNQSAGPDGLTSMALYTEAGATDRHGLGVTNPITQTTGATHATSFYVKDANTRYVTVGSVNQANVFYTATFDLNTGNKTDEHTGSTNGTVVSAYSKDMGGGVYRLVVIGNHSGLNRYPIISAATSSTPTVGTLGSESFAGRSQASFYASGAQDELGSTPTSLIKTYGNTAARDSDNIQMTAGFPMSEPFSGYGEAQFRPYDGFGRRLFELAQISGDGNRVVVYRDSATARNVLFSAATVFQALMSSSLGVDESVERMAFALATGDAAQSTNGGSVVGAGGVTIPTVNDLIQIGGTRGGGSNGAANGHIRKIILTMRQVPDADLTTWTTTGDLPDA